MTLTPQEVARVNQGASNMLEIITELRAYIEKIVEPKPEYTGMSIELFALKIYEIAHKGDNN